MELPPLLRQAVDSVLHGIPVDELRRAAQTLSERYRAEIRDGRLHMNSDLAVRAYLATRMPATYAAVNASFAAASDAMPDFEPKTMLDVGAGPGTALWAANAIWPMLQSATLLETSEPARRSGSRMAASLDALHVNWVAGDATLDLKTLGRHDLVSCAYVLDELAPASLGKLANELWSLTRGMLVFVEPGTPAGWQRILLARDHLLQAGASIAAPCAHEAACPLSPPDWCHFARRVARSRIHRLAKDAEVPWEDEKFIYLAATRQPPEERSMRVIAPVKAGSGKVHLKLCQPDGTATERLLTKRDGQAFKEARRSGWGSSLND